MFFYLIRLNMLRIFTLVKHVRVRQLFICITFVYKSPYQLYRNPTSQFQAMRKLLNLLFAIANIAPIYGVTPPDSVPDWENPQVVGINKEPYHSTLTLPSQREGHKEWRSLGGKWKFHRSPDPSSRPIDFFTEGFDSSGWSTITVPGTWQLQGYGTPIYTNQPYPFKRDAPRVTSEPPANYFSYENRNPVGSYLRTFNLDQKEAGKRYFLHFDGVKSAMYVWINGHKAGYSQNSMSPAEFDITDFIHSGENNLAVEVYRWSDGSYLEDQDMWRFSGIYRSVGLLTRPDRFISDYHITPTLSKDYAVGHTDVKVTVDNRSSRSQDNLEIEFLLSGKSRDGRDINIKRKAPVGKIQTGRFKTVTLSFQVDNPALWSAETPELYSAQLILRQDGKELERFESQTGFRHIEIDGEIFRINGQPVKLKGVNRHEHHPRTGRTIDEATIIRDLELLSSVMTLFGKKRMSTGLYLWSKETRITPV